MAIDSVCVRRASCVRLRIRSRSPYSWGVSEPVKEFTVLYLYDACRSVCKISERETAAALRARETNKRSATALAAPFVAVAAIAAFLDEVGPALGSDVAVLRDGQRKRVAANVLYGNCHAAWFKRPADGGVVANISLLKAPALAMLAATIASTTG